jgi:CIC family chloride channel protein
MIRRCSNFFQTLSRHYLTRLIFLCVLVGIAAALGAWMFTYVIDLAGDLFMTRLVGYHMPLPGAEGPTVIPDPATHRWLLFFVPSLGGLLSGLAIYWLAPDAAGHGTDAVINSFHRGGGAMRKRIPFVKTLATAFTLGSGGSAGREGPIMQVGSGFGSMIGGLFESGPRERRLLILAGAGAGLGAIFRSPLGGALFATEVLYRDVDFETPALVPSFIASIISYSIYCGMTGRWGAIFTVPAVRFNHVAELPVYVLLGILCALLGIIYLKAMHGAEEHVFGPLKLPVFAKPALGGLLLGCVGYFLPEVLGQGYGWVQLAMDGKLQLLLIVVVLGMKIIATSLTIGSGGSGGTFAPSVVIGGLLGTTVGLLLRRWLPGISPDLPAFALVGMAGFLAGVAKTPLSALIMVSEMTLGYGLLVPLMLATAGAYVLVPRRLSLFKSQVDARVDSPAHEGEFVAGALERIRVEEALPKDKKLVVFRRNSALDEILKAVSTSEQLVFPVLDEAGKLYGVIPFQSIRFFYTERQLPAGAVVATDLLAPTFSAVTLNEDLATALRKFRLARLEELPVVESENSMRVVGVLNRRDVLAAYHDRFV